MPQQAERLAVPAGEGGVRDGEGVGLDAAAVVPGDHLLRDLVLGVGQQLAACRSELGEILGERGDEGALGARRDAASVRKALTALQAGARAGANTMPLLLDAARAYATVGEMCDSLREVWGEYVETPVI